MTTLELNNIDVEALAYLAFPEAKGESIGPKLRRLCAVRDVLAGLPTPTFSQAERERVMEIYERTKP